MNSIHQDYPGFHTNAADFVMWAPSASVYAMDALNVKTAHNFREHLIIEARLYNHHCRYRLRHEAYIAQYKSI